MDRAKEFFACLAFRHIKKLGPAGWKQILGRYDSAFDAIRDGAFWPSRVPDCEGINAFSKQCVNESWRAKAEEEYKAAVAAGMDVVTWFDPRYPESLRQLSDPPVLFYLSGDSTLLKNPGVAVVGARECTSLGLKSAGRISAQLSKIGITVISGLALGIDRQAHLGGLKGIGSSIAVLGCGLDVDYPPGNRDVREALDAQGLVITEYAPGTPPRGGNFPVRNRLISGLSLGVLVAEAAHRSGSLITARLAGEQGKEVFALPGPIGQPTFTGCHKLIKQGAALVETAGDILEVLRYEFARELAEIGDPGSPEPEDLIPAEMVRVKVGDAPLKRTRKAKVVSDEPRARRPLAVERQDMPLNDEEREVMTVLGGTDKVHIDSLGRTLSWDSARISRVLLMLEMRGAVQQLPGMWYLAKES